MAYLGEVFAQQALCDMTPQDLQRELLAIAPGSRRRRALKTLRASLNTALRWGLIDKSPLEGIKVPVGIGASRSAEPYSAEELKGLIKAFEGHVGEACVTLMVYCGLRKEEALGLDWADLQLERGEVRIRRAWTLDAGRPLLKVPKTPESERVVFIFGKGLRRLRALARASGNGSSCGAGPVWPGRHEGRVRPDAASRAFRSVVLGAGLRYAPLSRLRHAYATLALASGVDVAVVSHSLGHAQTSTTVNRYVRPLSEARRKAARIYSRALG
jgi:integrase